MIDPAGFLRNVKAKLAPAGRLIASVPNVRYAPVLFNLLVRADFEYTEGGVLDYTHLHLFTRKSFTRLAEQCGWEVEVSAPHNNMPFKPLKRLALRLIEFFLPEIRNLQFAVRISPTISSSRTSDEPRVALRPSA